MADDTYFEIYKDEAAEWRWRFRVAGTRQIVGASNRSYETRKDCLDSIDVMKTCRGSMVYDLTEKPQQTEIG